MAEVILKDLVKLYGREIAVWGIDLHIPHGAFVVLVGPSGCGKSTTLRMIAGLESISHGDLSIGGRRVNDLDPQERGVAMVFQSYALYPHMTVRENLSFSLGLAKMRQAEVTTRIDRAVTALELGPHLARRPSERSGGQRQRVAMGRAIVREPEVFLFDEPLSNLDAKLRNQMRVEIKRLQHQLKVTTIYVTHDQVEAMTLADVIVVMKDGEIAQTGSPLEVFERPADRFVAGFIGTPQMNFVDGALRADSGGWRFDGGGLSIPVEPARFARLGAGRPVTLGLRPEDIVPDGHGLRPPGEVTLEATVTLSEMLGNETLLFAETPPMAAFALARLDLPRRDAWFLLIFAGTVFPFQMYLIPLFFGYQWARLLNSRLGMCLFYTAICIPFPVLVLRTYMNGLSREMDEAARMDGAREFTVFFRIVLPNMTGPMAAVFLLQFTWIWNDLLFSTILANRPETRSIMNALLFFQGSYSQQGPNIVMTGALLASIPTVVLFFLLRRRFMEGLRVS